MERRGKEYNTVSLHRSLRYKPSIPVAIMETPAVVSQCDKHYESTNFCGTSICFSLEIVREIEPDNKSKHDAYLGGNCFGKSRKIMGNLKR